MAAVVIQGVLLLLWLSSVAFYFISAWCLAAFFIRERQKGVVDKASAGSPPRHFPPLTVLKPLMGADGDTYPNLKSFVAQDYPAFQVIFGVADPADPAVGVAEALIAEYPALDLRLVTGGVSCPNRKVCNLANMSEHARYDILVIADSDMRVGPGYLRAVAAGFEDPAVGLVTCPYRGAHPENIGAALEALTINMDFLPSVAVAERLEGISFALGATMAVRKDALSRIGGFDALAGYLADDYQLGNKVGKAGFGLKLSGYLIDSVGRRETVGGFFSHQLRWGRTYRVCRPGGYFLSVLTKGTAFSVMFLAASGFSTLGWGVVAANLALRFGLALFTEALYVRGPGVIGYIWLLPARDIIGFIVWLLSFTGSTVKWKDESYLIGKDGRMTRIS